jgi:hypothetical protein
MFDYLQEIYEGVESQKRFGWCKGKKRFPYDFLVPIPDVNEGGILVEVDGAQHFRQISNWTSPEETQAKDKFKNQKAIENGYCMLRISQEDIYFNRLFTIYDGENEIEYGWKEMFEEIMTEMFTDPTPRIITMYGGEKVEIKY